MRFYEFGSWEAPVLLLLPGTCCRWKRNFGHVIPLLEGDFHVVCASYDGFDEQEDAVFPDMLTEAGRIEAFLQSNFHGRICAAYGCSLGGSLVGLLVQRGKVHIDHAILGSSDLDQERGMTARFKAWLVSIVLARILHRGALPRWMQRRVEARPERREYMEKMLEVFGIGAPQAFIRRKSIRNQFRSDLETPLADGIDVPGTTVHCFYAAKMGEKYLKRYQQHFKHPDIRRHELQHEELLCCDPEEWAREVRRCCGLSTKCGKRA